MKNIVILTTGGTIAMKQDPASGGLVPAVSGEDLIAAVPALKDIARITVREYSNVPSGHVTPRMMFELAQLCSELGERADVDGIVVTHGTDTMEETAYMLSMAVKHGKPVCITGAMRGAGDMGYDGPANILAAVKTAACDAAAGRGALLVFNDEIHAAAEVTKSHTVSCSTFASPGWGPIGHVYEDGVVFRRRSERCDSLPASRLQKDVALLKVCAGMDSFFFKAAADKPVAGLVVEAVGCGNVPPEVKKGLEYVRSKNIPVVLASRTAAGRVVPVYSYPGGAGDMLELELIHAGELSGVKARLRLMLALGAAADPTDVKEIAKYFADKEVHAL